MAGKIMGTNKRVCIDGFILKLVAMITMFIDHFGVVFIQRWAIINGCENLRSLDCKWSILYEAFRVVGRMAFPIYVFLLVEGFLKTSNRKKYALRILVFAIISEIPFDLAFSGKWFYLKYNNVMWTLLLGLLTIWLIEIVESGRVSFAQNMVMQRLAVMIISLASMLIATVAHTDYKFSGIAAVVIMYMLRDKRPMDFILAIVTMSVASWLEIFALLETPLLLYYNGKRGYNSKGLKYIFYSFYAVHLLILWGAAKICFKL